MDPHNDVKFDPINMAYIMTLNSMLPISVESWKNHIYDISAGGTILSKNKAQVRMLAQYLDLYTSIYTPYFTLQLQGFFNLVAIL